MPQEPIPSFRAPRQRRLAVLGDSAWKPCTSRETRGAKHARDVLHSPEIDAGTELFALLCSFIVSSTVLQPYTLLLPADRLNADDQLLIQISNAKSQSPHHVVDPLITLAQRQPPAESLHPRITV